MTHEIQWVTHLSCSCGRCISTQRGFANMDRITMWKLSATTLICWMLHLQPTFSRQNRQNRHGLKLNPLDSCLLLVYQINHQTVTQTEFSFTARQEKSSMTIKNKVELLRLTVFGWRTSWGWGSSRSRWCIVGYASWGSICLCMSQSTVQNNILLIKRRMEGTWNLHRLQFFKTKCYYSWKIYLKTFECFHL